ncbi:MAG: hypothetical protein V1809_01090 [Planctomycetota bacterium]
MNPAVRSALEEIFRRLDAEIAAMGASCAACGDCCRFKESGLVLMASRVEVERLLATSGPPPHPWDGNACPYLADDVCTAREGRVLGCRIYFCAPRMKPLMPGLYEKYLRDLKSLHDRLGIPWEYVRVMEALEESV